MAYEKNGYILHDREVKLKNGTTNKIYFFCKRGNKPKSGSPCEKPLSKVVGINAKTGLPYLKNR